MSNPSTTAPTYGDSLAARPENADSTSPSIKERSNEYVDNATTSMGRALQNAAEGLSQRADSARSSLDRAGQYLQQGRPEDFGRDLTDWVRNNPGPAIAAGMGVGFLLGRLFSR